MKKTCLSIVIGVMCSIHAFSQNVGIGTNSPNTKLEVNGAISSTPVNGTPAGGTVNIPSNISIFRILDDGANTAISVTAGTAYAGQYLTIYNTDALNDATFATQNIVAVNGVASFSYINGGWRAVSNTKAGGDLSGSYPNPTVVKIQGKAVSGATPVNGDILKYNTTTSQYEPSADLNSGGTVGTVTASSPLQSTGGNNPNISLTGVVPVANGGTGSSTTPSNGQILIGNGTGFGISTISPTNNQTTVTNNPGTIQIGTVQDIGTASSPTFSKVTLNGANMNSIDATGSVKIGSTNAAPATAGAGALQYTGGNVQYSDGSTWKTLSTGGTVTNVSVTSANGVSGSVTNPGTTPAISLTLGAITPTSVAASGTLSGSNFSGTHSGTSSGTNTGDQTNISGNAATVTTNANLTGPITSLGNATSIASQTGTGTTFAMSVSPTFTGTPTLPTATIAVTQTAGNSSTAVATTAFVTSAITTANATNANLTGMVTSIGNATTVVTNANLTGPITSVGNATSIASQTGTGNTFAMSVSPTFTGTPNLPTGTVAVTQGAGNNSTAIATTAFVTAAAAASVAGTTNYIPKFTSANTIGNSTTTDDGTTVTTSSQFDVTGGTGTSYTTAPIEVRTTLTPRIAFHWPGIVASQLGMDASGVIRTYNNPGTAYEQFAASNITANGTLTSTANLVVGTTVSNIGGYAPANGAIRLTPNLHLNANTNYAVILNWDNGATAASTQMLRIGNGASADMFGVLANGDVTIQNKLALRGNDTWLRLNQDGGFSSGTYNPGFLRIDGGIASGGLGSAGAGTITTTGSINTNTGFQVSSAAASGNYLRGNGANFVSSAIQAADLPAHTHTWAQVTAKPAAWLDAANLIQDNGNFNNSVPSGFYQSSGAANAPGGSWYNMINVRHSNTGNDHGFQIAASYYDEKIWTRTYQGGNGAGGGTFTPWAELQSSRSTSNSNWALSGTLVSSRDDLGTTNFDFDNDDDISYTRNLGFNITIDGTSYSQVSVSTNGLIVFGGAGAPACCSQTWPLTVSTAPMIAFYYHDMKDYGSGEFMRDYTVGAAPGRTWILRYQMREFSGTTSTLECMVMIHETSGLINVKYFGTNATLNGQANASNTVIGFQASGGASAKYYPVTYNGKVMDDNAQTDSWSISPVR